MDKEYNERMLNSVDALNKFIAYCEERGYTGSIAILKGMLEEAKKLTIPDAKITKPDLRLVVSKLSLEQRQIQAVIMILRYVLYSHPFLTLAPKCIGSTVTVTDENGLDVKYQIYFEGSWMGADIYQTAITVNPKWVIRISSIVVNKKIDNIKITSNFGKDFFGMENVEGEFDFKASGGQEEAANFIHMHLHEVAHVIQKANV